jgi:hypothetical protein
MLMACKHTNKSFVLADNDFEFIKAVLDRSSVVSNCSTCLTCDSVPPGDCIRLGYMLKHSIDANKIFEKIESNGTKVPIVVDDPVDKPDGFNALSVTTLVMLSKTATFLTNCKRGVDLKMPVG